MNVRRLFRRLSKKGPVRACYEASGAGFVLHRVLARDGFSCEVIAPSLIPRKPGEHRKTDHLDAVMLVKLYRSGHLTPSMFPPKTKKPFVDCFGCGSPTSPVQIDQASDLRNASQPWLGLSEGRSTWTKGHRRWLAEQRRTLSGPLQIALAAELEHLEYLEMQRDAFDDQIQRYAQTPPYRIPVEALCCLRGVKTLTAFTLLCEIDDIRRFRSPELSWPTSASSPPSTPRGNASEEDPSRRPERPRPARPCRGRLE